VHKETKDKDGKDNKEIKDKMDKITLETNQNNQHNEDLIISLVGLPAEDTKTFFSEYEAIDKEIGEVFNSFKNDDMHSGKIT